MSYPDQIQIKVEGFVFLEFDVTVTDGNELVRLAHCQLNIHNTPTSRTWDTQRQFITWDSSVEWDTF